MASFVLSGSGGQESAVTVSQGRAPSDGSRRGPPASPSLGGRVRHLDPWPHLPNLCLCQRAASGQPLHGVTVPAEVAFHGLVGSYKSAQHRGG